MCMGAGMFGARVGWGGVVVVANAGLAMCKAVCQQFWRQAGVSRFAERRVS